MLEHNLVLKSDETYLVGETSHDNGERATGLYVRDTRHLHHFTVRLNGVPLEVLGARALGPTTVVVVGANGAFPVSDDGGDDPAPMVNPHAVAVEQHVELDTDLRVRFVVRNFAGRTLPLTLSLGMSADFRDLFDIRGFSLPGERGTYLPPAMRADGVVLGYRDRTGAKVETAIRFDRQPTLALVDQAADAHPAEPVVLLPGYDRVTPPVLPPPPCVEAGFMATLAHGESDELTVVVTPLPAGEPVSAEAILHDGAPPRPAVVATDHPGFNRMLERAAADLAVLQTSFPEGSLPAAGLPWYLAPFGRDSLIVGLQTFHLAPRRTIATLRVLAALQGDTVATFREEEPGKILHEVRYGELARLGAIPHTPYYGTVDATPLFVLLFAETVNWTGDEALYADLLPNIRRALEWIERYGDLDGDGLVEYEARAADGVHIVHQGWKDSHDSLHHADGRPASGAIALVEVQGYVFAAYRRLADVVEARGDVRWAGHLRDRAEAMRRAVEDAFWLEDEQFYAQALDGRKAPVAVVSSNAGHLLFCGLPSPERAAAVAARLGRSDIDSGWGIRTLGATAPSYNPMSYHNGSVWPHDNSLIAAGLHAYGFAEPANRIASALVAAAATDPLARLPELYCGFAREEAAASAAPVAYPVSCSPQAWAAASSQLLVRAMLGLRVEPERGALLVEPALPAWLNEVVIRDLLVRGEPLSLTVARQGDGYAVAADGAIEVVGPALAAR